jgi:hypothetical protein
MGQLTGRAFIAAAGKRLASKEGAEIDIGALERKGQVGDTGVLGYTETTTIPYVECTLHHNADMSLQEYADMVDVTVSFDTDSGRSFVLRNAWRAGTVKMSKGEVKLRFEAMSCEEV